MCLGKNIIDPGGAVTRKVFGQETGDKIDPIGGLVHKAKPKPPQVIRASSLINTPKPASNSNGGTVILG